MEGGDVVAVLHMLMSDAAAQSRDIRGGTQIPKLASLHTFQKLKMQNNESSPGRGVSTLEETPHHPDW